MRVAVSPKAEEQLKKLSKLDQIAVVRKIRSLVGQVQEEKLKGYKEAYRVRVGNFRIVYLRLPDRIYVVLIAHRKEIYLLLKRLSGS
jgi:mRNA interferase RelE/StbE